MDSRFDNLLGSPRLGLSRQRSAALCCLLIGASLGCGSGDTEEGEEGVGSGGVGNTGAGGSSGLSGPSDAPATPASACDAVVVASPPTSAEHVLQCSALEYTTNPPSGGPHYAVWPLFQSYGFALPEGFLVHGLEHGAVVFWYNCPEGCADEVQQVEAFIAALPADPLCAGTGSARRAILVPSANLTSRWAASAWGFALNASCFDEQAFGAFYADHYAQGRENLCNPGAAFSEDPCL
jgi:uncharacterized protein DUF3105